MLILIAGITGNVGKHAARYGLEQGHQIRGMGRSPNKLDPDLLNKLESFVVNKTYYDIPALEKAVSGVDAVICAYTGLPELGLDGQLLLLRAAERAGIKRFMASGWNYDWRKIAFGDEPIYDAIIAFHAQASITSSIKPLHIFSGMFAEVFFGVEGQDGFTPRDRGVWDPQNVSMDIWGSGNETWFFTTQADAGKFGVEIITAPGAEEGGFFSLCSFRSSLKGIKDTYERVRNVQVKLNHLGPVEELVQKGKSGRRKHGRSGFWEWHRDVFLANCIKGVWNLDVEEGEALPHIKRTDLEAFLQLHPEV